MKLFFSATYLLLCLLVSFTVEGQQWLTNYDQARKVAEEQDRNIILVFQGSDWCAPCIKLDRAVWSTDEFQSYARDHFVMLQADFPRKKVNQLPADLQEHNGMLAEKYNAEGYFPLVVVLDKNGKVLGKTGYKKIPASDYITLFESFGE